MKHRDSFATLSLATRIALFVGALLFSALPIPSSAAPPPVPLGTGGIPIFVTPFQTTGLSSAEAADVQALNGLAATLLSDKAGCVTAMTPSDVASELGLARDQQLLGTPEEQQIRMEEIAGAMGGVLVGGTFSRIGDTYSVDVWTGKAGVVTDRTSASGKGTGLDAFINLLEKAVNSLNLKVCKPKWTGTVSLTEKYDYFHQRPGYLPMLANATRNGKAQEYFYDERTEELSAKVQSAVSTSNSPNRVEADLTRKLNGHGFNYGLATQDVDCSGSWGRQMRGDFEWRPWLYEWNTSMRVDAKDTKDGVININIDRNGHYTITVVFPAMKYKQFQQDFGRSHPSPCEAPRNLEGKPIEPEFTAQSRTITIEGDVDPRNPDRLSGETTDNTPSFKDPTGAMNSGSLTRKWNLTAGK